MAPSSLDPAQVHPVHARIAQPRLRCLIVAAALIALPACGDPDVEPDAGGTTRASSEPAAPAPGSAGAADPADTDPADTDPADDAAPPLQDPCSIFPRADLEAAAGFPLSDGVPFDLNNHGVEGSSCFYQAAESDQGDLSVSVIADSMAAAVLADVGGEPFDGLGDEATVVLGDIQSNIYVLTGDTLLGVDLVHVPGTRPDDDELGRRLVDLMRSAAS